VCNPTREACLADGTPRNNNWCNKVPRVTAEIELKTRLWNCGHVREDTLALIF